MSNTQAEPEVKDFNIPGARRVEGNRHIYLMSDGKSTFAIDEYYIGLGPTSTFYTLWHMRVFPTSPYNRERYHQNLAQDAKEAIAKAKELCGCDLSDDIFDIDNHGKKIERHARAAGVFHFGRYNGQSIQAVYEEDPSYVNFLAQSGWTPSDIAARNNLLYIQARYGDTAAEQQYFSDSVAYIRSVDKAVADAARKDIPVSFLSTRPTIRATVLGFKVVEDDYGTHTKVLLEHQDGWKVYGNVFGVEAVENGNKVYPALEKGMTIEFQARLQLSNRDSKFAFFKRATKGHVISQPAVTA